MKPINVLNKLNESSEAYIEIPLWLLYDLEDSLSSVLGYADDGNLSRDDENYSEFFKSIDKANETLEKAREYHEKYSSSHSIHSMLVDDEEE